VACEYTIYEETGEERKEIAAEEREIAGICDRRVQEAVVAGDNHGEVQAGESGRETEPQHDLSGIEKQGISRHNAADAPETAWEAEKRT